MSQTASYTWFARHEFELSWRDLYAMMSGNRAGRGSRITLFLAIVILGLHGLAYLVLAPMAAKGIELDLPTLGMISGFLLLPVSLMASQAMESITRAFYTRSDLELILASPAPSTRLFAVRMFAIALSTTSLTLLVSAPAINVLAMIDRAGWLLAYPVIIAFGLLATAFAILLTMGLFLLIGPARTRLIAQIAAAVVGAGFVIGVQLIAIASIGTISRIQFLTSETFISWLPDAGSVLWLPALGASGNPGPALAMLIGCAIVFLATIAITAGKYAGIVLMAASIDMASGPVKAVKVDFQDISSRAVLRRKEWKLLLRDKWLLSQTLMQLLYLIPPAFMLWQGFGQDGSPELIVIPVIVMASGQLAGGLAWLAISGEDAPELVQTAPVEAGQVTRAKVEAVLFGVGIVVSPLILLTGFLSLSAAMIGLICVFASVINATMIQLWFRSQSKRSNFRRRQTSSRMATISEAFSSIMWAGTAGLWIGGTWIALITAIIVFAILFATWWISPARQLANGTNSQ